MKIGDIDPDAFLRWAKAINPHMTPEAARKLIRDLKAKVREKQRRGRHPQ